MRQWTQAQNQVINSTGSILVSASAGTGKTAVLTEKVVNSITRDSINIDEMIIMTFSSAAANQMKERIRDRIKEIVSDESVDRKTKNMLWKQYRNISDAHIQTIHSFCNELIKKYFYAINMDPNLRVADNFDVAIMKNNVITEVLSIEYNKLDEDFIALCNMLDDTETIEQMFIKAYDKIVSFIDYRAWLRASVEKYNTTVLSDEIKAFILEDFNTAISLYCEAISELKTEVLVNPKLQKILEVFEIDCNILENVKNKIINNSITNITSELSSFGDTVRFPNGGDYDFIKAMRNKARDTIVSKYKKVNFDIDKQVKRINSMYAIMKKFEEIFLCFDDKYTSLKREKKVIDFHDMEKYAYQILQNDAISSECKYTFKRVFIDEYQDTNPIQEAIVDKISSSNNLFCVGDLKQSIYRFRSSDPTLFLQRSQRYTQNVSLGNIISLNNNFRSAQNILDCSNDIFNHITKSSNEIDYTTDDMLVHGRKDDNAICPVVVDLISESFRGNDDLSLEEIEIYNMVNIINDNIGKDIYDSKTGTYRPAEYKDIVILCRKLTGLTDDITRILSSNNIPFVIEKSGNLLDTTEVQIIMNIIDLINNPKNDLKLVSLMHLGIFGFTDDDIITLKNMSTESYYNTMNAINDGSELSNKCHTMFAFFENCREKQKYLSLSNILDYIISELHLMDVFSIKKNGVQRIANIQELKKHAYDFENKYCENLYGFSQYIQNIKDSETNVDEAIVNYDENSVKITTIHKSKGLEYPIVILAFAGKQFNRMDKRANVVIDKDAGIGVKYYDDKNKVKGRCLLRSYIENEIDKKSTEEEMRLLYVAMTRAEEKLYIQGTCSDGNNFAELNESNSFLHWVMNTLAHSSEFSVLFGNESSIVLNGSWDIEFVKYEDISKNIENEALETDVNSVISQYTPFTTFDEKQNSSYKEYVPLVLSASTGLKKMEISENSLKTPDFINSDSAMTLGTIAHEFLRYANLRNCSTLEGVINEKEKLISLGIMSQEDLDKINIENICNFFNSNLGEFIISCDKFYKEKYVNVIKNARDIGYFEDNDILVRCIIDLICEKDGKYYLIDYKTDKIKDTNDTNEIKNKALTHKTQLDLYKDALLKMYGVEIEKSYIAFVNFGVYAEV